MISGLEELLAEHRPGPKPLTAAERASAVSYSSARPTGVTGPAAHYPDLGGQAFVNAALNVADSRPGRLSAGEERELSDMATYERDGRRLPPEYERRRQEIYERQRRYNEGEATAMEIKRHLISGDRVALKRALARHPKGQDLANRL